MPKTTISVISSGADPGFGQGGPRFQAESCQHSRVELHEQSEQTAARVWGLLEGPGSFWVLMLRYAFSCILETLFLSFFASASTPKADKNRTLNCTSINLRYSYIIHIFLIFMKKLCFDWMTWGGMLSKVRPENFMTWAVKNRSIVWLVTHCFSLMSQSVSSTWKFTFKNR